MIADSKTLEWLEHRAGLRRLVSHPKPDYSKRALQLSAGSESFLAAFGRKDIRGFTGFVDLIGFSTRSMGMPPSQMSSYLKPFLEGVINGGLRCGALIDKTIGDEVMFVLPDTQDDGGISGFFDMACLVVQLLNLSKQLGNAYPFRLGLSYGNLYVDQIEGQGYAEWTVIGEAVNLAKRLQDLESVEPVEGFGGAFGSLISEVSEREFRNMLEFITGSETRMTYEVRPLRKAHQRYFAGEAGFASTHIEELL